MREKRGNESKEALPRPSRSPRGLRALCEQSVGSSGGRGGGHVRGGPRGRSGAHLILYNRPFPRSLATFFPIHILGLGADPGALDFGLWLLGFDIFYHSFGPLVLDL